MKVAVVVQRYGLDIVGGAEFHARSIAERLVSDLGWDVTVLTTTAKDYLSWRPAYKEGGEVINGVKVQRFDVSFPRISPLFGAVSLVILPVLALLRRFRACDRLVRSLEALWLVLQGPYSPKLLSAIKTQNNQFERIYFFTYLYAPTQWGAVSMGKKAFLVPTAHDESALYFFHTRTLFQSVTKILVNTEAEKRLILSVCSDIAQKIQVVGIGVDEGSPTQTENAAQAVNIPYLLYLGRIGKGKGVDRLLSYFKRYLDLNKNSPLKLILAGSIDNDFKIPQFEGFHYRGFVTGDEKKNLIRNCLCVVNPSPLESLSLLALEAMVLKKPLLLNKECAVFADYIAELPSVRGFNDFDSFRRGLTEILNCHKNSDIERDLIQSQQWVLDKYSWRKVLEIYQG